jgi:hypothetical protein
MRRLDAFHMKAAEQNASSLALYIGKTGALRCEYLSVDITVADAKRSYGRTLLLVRPVVGTGEQWVEESRIRWPQEDDAGLSRARTRP